MSHDSLETRRLSDLEIVIERGQQTFIEVGLALAEIRDSRLYREAFATFEDYCRGRWGWGASHARNLIGSAEAIAEMASATIVALPSVANEGQARELAKIKDPEIRAAVWEQANEMAESLQTTVTARLVRDAVAVERGIEQYQQNPHVPDPPAPPVVPATRQHFPSDESIWICARLRELEEQCVAPGADINALIADMYPTMKDDVRRIVPSLICWLGEMEKDFYE